MTLDIETFSRADLKKAGLAAYAEDESTDILCACWALDDGPVDAWIPSADDEFRQALFKLDDPALRGGNIYIGSEVPLPVRKHIEAHKPVHSWNNPFERKSLSGPAGRRYNWPEMKIPNMRCSMANARAHGLPGGLENAAEAVGSPVKKRIAGVNAMRYLCKPRKDGSRPLLTEERERFLQLVPYCGDDVRAERAVDDIVPLMTAAEQSNWEMDQEMNDLGWLTDPAMCDDMEILVQQYKKELEARCRTMTGIKPSRPGPLAAWVREHGFPSLENLQADTVRKVLKREDCPEDVKTVLKIYSTFNMKAVAKYPAMRKAICKDGRLRHLFMYFGAGTGRWSSVIVQLQNLFRPVIDDPEIAIAAAAGWDLEWIRNLYPGTDPMKVIASCVRGALIAAPGKELVFPDYAGVEARWNAWMFNETWKLEAYRDYDRGIGANLYCVVYGQCFGVDPRSREGLAGKQQGKVLDLSMGYEGGVGAFVKMANTYRVDLRAMAEATYPTLPADVREEAVDAYHYAAETGRLYELPEKIWITCESLKRLWRRAHPRIVQGWKDLKKASLQAVANPGVIYKIPNGKVMFKVEGDFLIMRLPSGRRMWYYKPRIKMDNKFREVLYYMGVNTVTRQWGVTSTYGGKTCENETQGGCRDLLVRAKQAFRKDGWPLIGSVHDQPVMETGIGAMEDDYIRKTMCTSDDWDQGMPLAVEIHRGPRFRK